MAAMILFHTGFAEIPEPDIKIGRKNADFGQGFYLCGDEEFSKRWARHRRDYNTYLNKYELDTDSLNIKRFTRNEEWFDYIYSNRSFAKDLYADADVIIGPIANDTIYDTLGITTSGLLKKEHALKLLTIGPVYEQTVIKTEKAVSKLKFVFSEVLKEEAIEKFRATVKKEEERFQEEFAALLESLLD